MIEIHIGDNVYLFNEPRYQTRKYSYTKYKSMAELLNKNIPLETADLYSSYYSEMKINHCQYDKSIENKLKSFGLLL